MSVGLGRVGDLLFRTHSQQRARASRGQRHHQDNHRNASLKSDNMAAPPERARRSHPVASRGPLRARSCGRAEPRCTSRIRSVIGHKERFPAGPACRHFCAGRDEGGDKFLASSFAGFSQYLFSANFSHVFATHLSLVPFQDLG